MRFLFPLLFIALALRAQKISYDSIALLSGREDTQSVNLKCRLVFDFVSNGNYDSALKYSNSLIATSRKINYRKGQILSYNLLGMISRNKGDGNAALQYYLTALRLAEAEGNKRLASNLHHNIARVYDNQGNYSKALEHLFLSLKIKELNADQRGIANTLSHIGNIYYAQKDSRALAYFNRSLKIQEEIKNYAGITIALNEIGQVYQDEKNYDKAVSCFLRSLEINKTANYKPAVARSLKNIGTLYKLRGKYTEGLENYLKALAIEKELNNYEEQATTLIYIGQLYFDQKEYPKALNYFMRGDSLAHTSDVLKLIREAYEGLSSVYSALNDHKKALYYYKSYIAARDSIYSDNNRKAAISAQLKYEYEKKVLADRIRSFEEKKLSSAAIKQARIQNYALIVTLFLLLLLGILVLQRFRHNQKLKDFKLRDKIASDLHDDIGSGLSSISMFSGVLRMNLAHGKEEATVKKIEETSREIIESINDIVWSVKPGNNKLEHVVMRMQTFAAALLNALNIEFHFITSYSSEINLKMEQRKNLYLIFKEAINNAAKYSLAKNITVEISQQARFVRMSVTDDGTGFNLSRSDSGNGLHTMKQRAEELNGELTISSVLGEGTSIILVFKPT